MWSLNGLTLCEIKFDRKVKLEDILNTPDGIFFFFTKFLCNTIDS